LVGFLLVLLYLLIYERFMSFKYTKGSTVQGDIKAADDTQRDMVH
jgi:hypothetical protein